MQTYSQPCRPFFVLAVVQFKDDRMNALYTGLHILDWLSTKLWMKMRPWINVTWKMGRAVVESCFIFHLWSQLFTGVGYFKKEKMKSLSCVNSLLVGLLSSCKTPSALSGCFVIQTPTQVATRHNHKMGNTVFSSVCCRTAARSSYN